MTQGVKIHGLRELRGAFKAVDQKLPGTLRVRFLDIARDVSATVAGKVPRRTGRAAGSVTPRASKQGASIAVGGQKAEHYPWLDFGGSVGRGRSIKREIIPGGRYLYPGIAQERDETEAAAIAAVEEAARDLDFLVRGF